MGIYGAMNTAVSGMRAQSFALENISGNIANAQTTGFKRIDTSFSDLVSGTTGSTKRQMTGSVNSNSRATNMVQGTLEASSTETFMAVNGVGYFTVQERASEVDGRSIFSGTDLFTRRGDFTMDREGYLVNGSGYYLKGLRLDPDTGNPVGSVSEVIRLETDTLPATPTTQITYTANLSSNPLTVRYQSLPTTPNSNLLDPAITTGSNITAAQNQTFLDSTISGGAVTAYDTLGAPVNVQFRWAKIENRNPLTPGTSDRWQLFYLSNSEATGAQTQWTNTGQTFTFDAAGRLTAPTAGVTLPTVQVNANVINNVEINFGLGGLTQFSKPSGDVQVTTLSQNGMPPGELVNIGIRDGGRISANFSNGRQRDIALIPLVSFNAESQLRRLDGGAFQATQESGGPIQGQTGDVVGATLEASNTDIADEFSKLIVTQQAYSANSRVISTSNNMMQDVLNIIR
jgi:flagellar hook protein FlgE